MVEHENISLAAAALNMKELFLLFFFRQKTFYYNQFVNFLPSFFFPFYSTVFSRERKYSKVMFINTAT